MEETDGLSLLKIASEMNAEQVGGILAEIEKYSAIIDKISGFLTRLNRIGVLPAVIRIYAAKTGVSGDINAPLQHPLSVTAASSTHKFLFDNLNEQAEEVIKAFLQQGMKEQPQAQKPKKEAKK